MKSMRTIKVKKRPPSVGGIIIEEVMPFWSSKLIVISPE